MFKRMLVDNSLHLEFSSEMRNTDRASAEIRDFFMLRGLRLVSFEAAIICREAINNAVEHGNKLDVKRVVIFAMSMDNQELIVKVEDQGEGFDWRNHDYSLPEPNRESGRGLFLIGHYADELHFNNAGNKLTILKRLGSSH